MKLLSTSDRWILCIHHSINCQCQNWGALLSTNMLNIKPLNLISPGSLELYERTAEWAVAVVSSAPVSPLCYDLVTCHAASRTAASPLRHERQCTQTVTPDQNRAWHTARARIKSYCKSRGREDVRRSWHPLLLSRWPGTYRINNISGLQE